ncbi:MAG: 2-(1,2-epoxy-1,2-dihydrophenyl)acetyl-CoA isomerase [Xanthobacteraceae bacterium]|nr:MAG: 2-(1,2-epoxy-1,2-dihydrophenyl)acetyl-CoA isomerase [Xanthobacteraceae bacterium]
MPQSSAFAPSVLCATADGITTITLNRPDRLNAFNVAMHRELAAALETAGRDTACRVVVLKGAGRAFCSGQDLSDRRVAPGAPRPDLGASLDTYYNPLIRRIRTLEKPVVAVVHGIAAGAGSSLALACDIVIAGRAARFAQSFTKVGIIPDSAATWTLPRLIGDARARAIALLAETVTAEQAADWGLIWKVVDDDALSAEAGALAARLAAAAPVALALAKQAFLASAANSLDAQLDLERDLNRIAGYTPDYAEAVAAFAEKRQPRFTGKKN